MSVSKEVETILIGNKEDLVHLRKVPKKDIEDFVRDYKLTYLETSALTSLNVDKAFFFLMKAITKKLELWLCDKEINKFFDKQN
jgi:hypothetical protein